MTTTRPPIACFGDWHGATGWGITAIRSAAREGVRHAIHVGDFGLDWLGGMHGRMEAKLNRYLVDFGMTLTISPGNHDNWEYLARLEPGEDGTCQVRSNINVLPKGGRTQIEGLTVGALGGAFSVDLEHRREGRDWWANEEPTEVEARALIDGGPVDILITHDAPAGVPLGSSLDLRQNLRERADRTRTLLAGVVQELAPPLVVCGHWHTRKTSELVNPGGVTRVDVLHMENSREGNGILVWPGDPLRVEPLFIKGS
jgi:hypothetical protein